MLVPLNDYQSADCQVQFGDLKNENFVEENFILFFGKVSYPVGFMAAPTTTPHRHSDIIESSKYKGR